MKRFLNNLVTFIKLRFLFLKQKHEKGSGEMKELFEEMYQSLPTCCQNCKWCQFHLQYGDTQAYRCRITREELVTIYSKNEEGNFEVASIDECEYFYPKEDKVELTFNSLNEKITKIHLNKSIRTLKGYCNNVSKEKCLKGKCLLSDGEGCPLGMPCDWEEI